MKAALLGIGLFCAVALLLRSRRASIGRDRRYGSAWSQMGGGFTRWNEWNPLKANRLFYLFLACMVIAFLVVKR